MSIRSISSNAPLRRCRRFALPPHSIIVALALATRSHAADFTSDIAPILEAKCISCHGAEKAKGGYRVHTFESLSQAGKSKRPPITAHSPDESELFKRLTAKDEDDRMPQKDEPLSPTQIELFRSWIADGARLDRGEPTALIASLIPARPHPLPPEKYRRPLPIIALAFTPDGKLAASGYNEVTVWTTSGELVRRITNVAQRVRSIAFDHAGKRLAVAGGQPGRSGELSIYDYESGTLQTNLLRTSDEILAVSFSPDDKLLACAGTDNAIHLFNAESLQATITIQQHADWVTALAFNTNATQIASASRDRTARVYNTTSGNLETTYTGQNAPLYSVAFLADGNVASGGRDKTIHLWDTKEGKKKGEISGFGGEIEALFATKDFVFSASADGLVKQHALSDRKIVHTFTGHADAVYALACDRDGSALASGSYDGVINLWNIATGALDKTFVAAPGWSSSR